MSDIDNAAILPYHGNARTTVFARRLMVERVATGWPPDRVAEQLGVSRATDYKW